MNFKYSITVIANGMVTQDYNIVMDCDDRDWFASFIVNKTQQLIIENDNTFYCEWFMYVNIWDEDQSLEVDIIEPYLDDREFDYDDYKYKIFDFIIPPVGVDNDKIVRFVPKK